MAANTPTVAQLLASAEPLPLDVDIAALATPDIPRADGEDLNAYTLRLLDEAHAQNPARRRHCAMGWHGDCTDRYGTDGCGCVCHALLLRLYADHPILHACMAACGDASVYRADRNLHAGWTLLRDLEHAGLHVTLAPGPDRPPVYDPADRAERDHLVRVLWDDPDGDPDDAGAGHVAQILVALAHHGVALTRTATT